jgi:DNA-binding transcriptional ArsR family regulator
VPPGGKNTLDDVFHIHNHMVVDYLSATFAALSDPTRRAIVDRLTEGPATVMELAAPFSISQQAISKHLAYLENAHLIEKLRDGRQNFCALKPDTLREVADWAQGYRRVWEKSFQRLDRLLAEMKARKKSRTTKTAAKKRKQR